MVGVEHVGALKTEMPGDRSALVLFSGGQDSTTCLAWALERFATVETIGFAYGQRHLVELQVRPRVFSEIRSRFPLWAKRLGSDRVIELDLASVSCSGLLRDARNITRRSDDLPNTFVPGRNLLFLLYASIIAEERSIKDLVIGACETDYSGYPDCRNNTIKAFQVAVNLGLQSRLAFHTPLMSLTKAQTWALAFQLGRDPLISIILEESHTCYEGDRLHRHEWGYGCAECDACRLRSKGWIQFKKRIAV